MTISQHVYTAKVTSPTPIVVAPSYEVEHPAVEVWSLSAGQYTTGVTTGSTTQVPNYWYDSAEQAAWSVDRIAGTFTDQPEFMIVPGYHYQYWDGAKYAVLPQKRPRLWAIVSSQLQSTDDKSGRTVRYRRIISGLVPGAPVSFTVTIPSYGGTSLPSGAHTRFGVTGKSYTSYTSNGTGNFTYSFTATATSHEIYIEFKDALPWFSKLAVNTGEWTQTIPAVTTSEIDLNVTGGSISLDAGRAPHVMGDIEVPIPGVWSNVDIADPLNPGETIQAPRWSPHPGALDALDPRNSPRVIVTATDGTNSRTFNLGVRDRAVNRKEGTLSLTLASDEAVAMDYGLPVDDAGAFAFQSSLRDVIDYVLTKVGLSPLASLPANDADVTTYSDATNLLPNPIAHTNTTGWASLNLASLGRQTSATWAANTAKTAFRLFGNSGNNNSYMEYKFTSGVAGKRMLFRARTRNGGTVASPGGNASKLRVYSSTNNGSSYTLLGEAQGATAVNAQTDLFVVANVPANATHVILRLYHGYSHADSVFWTDIQAMAFAGDPTDTAYWDGSTPDTAYYVYDWHDATGTSSSTRTAVVDRPPDSLSWRAGVSAYEFLLPVVQAQGLRLVCDENRVWTLRDEAYEAPGKLNLREGINLTEADESISRDGDTWFDARVTRYKWTDSDGIQRERVDAYAPAGYTRMSTTEVNAAYPGPGRSEYAVRRAQGRGRELSMEAVSDWTAVAEQPLQAILPDTPPQLGTAQVVSFDLNTDRMQITARTIDTPVGAVNLLPGTVNALTGTVNSL